MNRVNNFGNRACVLYVEDQPVNVMLMTALFEKRPGLRLVIAMSLREALIRAEGLCPSLLLLDLRLPDGDGRDLLPRLRGIRGCELAPAVAVTAEDEFQSSGHGFTEIWRKPLDLLQTLRRIDALLLQVAPPSDVVEPTRVKNSGQGRGVAPCPAAAVSTSGRM